MHKGNKERLLKGKNNMIKADIYGVYMSRKLLNWGF